MRKLITIVIYLYLGAAYALWAQKNGLVLLKAFPSMESKIEDDYLVHPFDLKAFQDYFIVSDAEECCIKVFSKSGDFIRKIGRKGQGPGELGAIFKFDVDEIKAVIYCADSGNSRVSAFSLNGEFKSSIKAIFPPRNLVYFQGKIIASSYNRNKKTLFTLYNSDYRLTRSFGELFDKDIPDSQYASVLYSMHNFAKDDDYIYVLYEYLPYISVFDGEGKLVKTISIKDESVKQIHENNIKSIKKGPLDNVLSVSPWNKGGCLYNKKIYYLNFRTEEILIFDLNGNLIQRVLFNDKDDKLYFRLITIDDGMYVFIDVYSGQVKIYKEMKG